MRVPHIDPASPPPGPFRREFWRSPLRGPRLTAVLGLALLIGIPLVAVTGLLSSDAYQPGLGGNALGRNLGPLDFYLFGWPTHPAWLYALTQGAHVSIGLALVPILLAKLWSVIPRLFEWPPTRSPAHALERLSLALLVGGALFEFVTGILDIELWYPFHFFFTPAHYYGAWVFIAAFTAHVVLKFGTMRRSLKTRRELGDLVPIAPAPASISRRALLATVGAGSLLLLLQGVGQSLGGPIRSLAFLAPRGRVGSGRQGFPVNRTAAVAGISSVSVGDDWRLELAGKRTRAYTRAELLAMPQHTYELPIACVEGWSTTQHWSGARLRDLAVLAGVDGRATMEAVSIEQNGVFGRASLGHEQIADERALLALRVNGADLSLDHGYPARVIAPALPGVHCTKWVRQLSFRSERA